MSLWPLSRKALMVLFVLWVALIVVSLLANNALVVVVVLFIAAVAGGGCLGMVMFSVAPSLDVHRRWTIGQVVVGLALAALSAVLVQMRLPVPRLVLAHYFTIIVGVILAAASLWSYWAARRFTVDV